MSTKTKSTFVATGVWVLVFACGAVTMHGVFAPRSTVNWSQPRISAVQAWWTHLAVCSVMLYLGSLAVLFTIFWRKLDLKAKVSLASTLVGNWLLFAVAELVADVDRIPQFRSDGLGAASWFLYLVEVALWCTTFFILASNVDRLKSAQVAWSHRNTSEPESGSPPQVSTK